MLEKPEIHTWTFNRGATDWYGRMWQAYRLRRVRKQVFRQPEANIRNDYE